MRTYRNTYTHSLGGKGSSTRWYLWTSCLTDGREWTRWSPFIWGTPAQHFTYRIRMYFHIKINCQAKASSMILWIPDSDSVSVTKVSESTDSPSPDGINSSSSSSSCDTPAVASRLHLLDIVSSVTSSHSSSSMADGSGFGASLSCSLVGWVSSAVSTTS